MRGLTSTAILAVVLAALVGYIYFVDAKRPASGAEERERAFAGIEADKLEELQLTVEGGETARLVKGGDGWAMVAPDKAGADSAEVTSLTSNLASLEVQRVVDEAPADLAQYGLEPPRVTVAFRVEGEKEPRTLLLGERTPAGGDMYAKLQDDPKVFLVASYLDTTFNRTPFDLRDKSLLAFDRDKADTLEIARPGSTIQFTKTETEWKISRPIEARGDFGAIEAVVSRLANGRMQRIVEDGPTDLRQYGLAQPAITATIGAGSARASLALGRSEGGSTYAKDAARPIVFAVDESLAEDLKKDVAEFRRKDVFDSRSFNISRIEVARGPETFVFERAKDSDGTDIWRNAEGATADSAKVEEMLSRLSGLRATSFQQARPAGLVMPEVSVTAVYDGGKSETVQFGRAGDQIVASRADDPGFALLDDTAYQNAISALDALR